jgi:hypothetical protein
MTSVPLFGAIDPLAPLLSELLRATPPDALYHYTSLDGLCGILTSKAVWATMAHFLSDAQEFRHALSIAANRLASHEQRETDQGRQAVLRDLRESLRQIERIHVCVFSLSEEGDLLSQWRGYCPPNAGYSIGFRGASLRPILAPQRCVLAPCVYEPNRQAALVDEALGPLLTKLTSPDPNDGVAVRAASDPLINELFARLGGLAVLLKDPSFSEEKEWRIVSPLVAADHPQMDYRVGRSMLLPHFVVNLVPGGGTFPLGGIYIGPTVHPSLAQMSLINFLSKHKLLVSGMRILGSRVPYRSGI